MYLELPLYKQNLHQLYLIASWSSPNFDPPLVITTSGVAVGVRSSNTNIGWAAIPTGQKNWCVYYMRLDIS